MQHFIFFINTTSGRFSLIHGYIIVKLNFLSPRFLTNLLQVLNVLQSLPTFEEEKQYFVNSSFSLFDDHVNSTNETTVLQ